MFRLFAATCAIVLALILPSRPAMACACCDTHRVVNVAPNDVLNIRTGPSTRFPVIGGIEHNAGCVIVTGPCQRNWCKISYIEQTGWVYMRYLKFQSFPSQ